MGHDAKSGAVAFPVAFHSRLVGLMSLPSAMPESFRLPAQVALKDPLAVVAVCSLTDHLKSPQALGDGMMFPEVHTPTNAVVPVAAGPVMLLLRSKLKQPVVPRRQTAAMAVKVRFLIFFISDVRRANFRPFRQLECKKYSSGEMPIYRQLRMRSAIAHAKLPPPDHFCKRKPSRYCDRPSRVL